MPLVKSASKSAFRKNVTAEAHAGKPIKQAVAIAMRSAGTPSGAKMGRPSSKAVNWIFSKRLRSSVSARSFT